MRINFQSSDMFKYKFKRDPKVWSIEELHSLWIKSKLRANKRNDYFWKLIIEAGESLSGDNNEKSIYYYHLNKDGSKSLRRYKIYFTSRWGGSGGFSYSQDSVSFTNRDEKLDFWIANEGTFELGQKIYEAQKFNSWKFEQIVYTVLVDEINKILNKKYRDLKTYPPKSFTIKIGGIEYIISTSDNVNSYSSYNKFSLICEKKEVSL